MPKLMHYLRYLAAFEPARLRAIWTAALALLLTLGISIPEQVSAKVTALIGLLAVVLPIVQGELTRAKVTPITAVDQSTPVVPYVPATDPSEPAPSQSDNSARPQDGPQDGVPQTPVVQS